MKVELRILICCNYIRVISFISNQIHSYPSDDGLKRIRKLYQQISVNAVLLDFTHNAFRNPYDNTYPILKTQKALTSKRMPINFPLISNRFKTTNQLLHWIQFINNICKKETHSLEIKLFALETMSPKYLMEKWFHVFINGSFACHQKYIVSSFLCELFLLLCICGSVKQLNCIYDKFDNVILFKDSKTAILVIVNQNVDMSIQKLNAKYHIHSKNSMQTPW